MSALSPHSRTATFRLWQTLTSHVRHILDACVVVQSAVGAPHVVKGPRVIFTAERNLRMQFAQHTRLLFAVQVNPAVS